MNNFQLGVEAYKKGEREKARQYFRDATYDNPKDEKAWEGLYHTSEYLEDRILYLKKILEINPANESARKRLKEITPKKLVPPTPEERPKPASNLPKKNNNTLLIIGIVAIAFLFICCIAIALSLGSTDIQVKYVLSGSATSALVTYNNEQGGTEQANVNIPFTKEMSVSTGAILSLVAQNEGSGSLTCEIWVNGKQTKTSTSTAQYGVVTCTDFAQ